MRICLLLFLLTSPVLAGQSLEIIPGAGTSANDPNISSSQDWRVEFQLHNWGTPVAESSIFGLSGTGVQAAFEADGSLRVYDLRDTGGYCSLPLIGLTNILVRAQRLASTKQFNCEIWSYDGTQYQTSLNVITSTNSWGFSGGGVGGAGNSVTFHVGFLRISTTTIPLASIPPTTAQPGDYAELKYDGNLLDSSGNGHDQVVNTGTFTYVTTPNQVAASIIKTVGAKTWTPWIAMRAGFANQLDGTSSYTLADSTNAASYFWQQLAGPTVATWSSRTAAKPLISNLSFGTYTIQLTVTDINGSTAQSKLDIGAVATDNNHIVIYPDARLNPILGPTIAYGWNPWEYVDNRQLLIEEYWGNKFAINGGTWDYEPDLTTLGGVPRLGTAYVDMSSNVVHGVGANFADVFCGGVTTANAPVINGASNISIKDPRAGTAPVAYYRLISSCSGQNMLTMASGYYWETQPTVTAPGVPWGTMNQCGTCGDWSDANKGGSNLNYYDGQGLANYGFYYRSGWEKPHKTAQWVADHWYRNGFTTAPRDFDLESAMVRATLDSTSNPPAYPAWPTIRARLNTISTSAYPFPGTQIADAREDGSGLIWRATQAMLDPDLTAQATAQTFLSASYAQKWQAQQTSSGTWDQNVAGGDTAHAFQLSQNSSTATLVSGTPVSTNTYCGENQLRGSTAVNGGTLTVGSDRLTVATNGINLTTLNLSPLDVVAITATLGGKPWTMIALVNAVASSSTFTLAEKWRGDVPATATSYRLFNGNGGFRNSAYNLYFIKSDNLGNFANPLVQDADTFYMCNVSTDGTKLFLDKPYTGDTSGGNVYRITQVQDMAGSGIYAYMVGFANWGASIAAAASTSTVISSGYNSLIDKSASWIRNYAYNNITGGSRYEVDSSNCQNLLDSYEPAYNCSGNNPSQAKSYLVENGVGINRSYLNNTSSATLKTFGDTIYNGMYAAPGYAVPQGFTADPNVADITVLDSFAQTKFYGQMFNFGQASSWPAARLGGVTPVNNRTVLMSFTLPSGATQARFTVTAPSSASTVTTCATSPCSVSVDARQGNHLLKIDYLNGSSAVIFSGENQGLLI